MKITDFDSVLKNLEKHLNIAAKASRRKTKIIKLLSNIDIKPSIYKFIKIINNMNLQELLNKWNIKCDVNTVLAMWNESHRSYHTLNHLNDLIDQINENKISFNEKEYEKLLITALFHDCVYDPMKQDNEEKSAEFFLECCQDKSNQDIKEINQMILDTKNHEPSNRLSSNFIQFDMDVITNGNYDQLLDWENGIAKEYEKYGDLYKDGRVKFLESLLDKHPYIYNSNNISDLIEYVKTNY